MTDQQGATSKKKPSRKASDTPTGTVTFIFTDIEGSTALWENYPTQMQNALARHDEILRSEVEASGGYVFKTIGDAYCAAFATARQALEATLAAQRALVAEPWAPEVEVRVRMALHTGVAEERDGDYFGPPVNRVARLLSTGHGGQILLSAVSYGLVRDVLVHLEPEAELRDLGEHRLKDLRYTEHIFQLVVPDLPAEFPPLKTHGLVAPAAGSATPDPPAPRKEHIRGEASSKKDERYRRIRPMGNGGMAEVYLAHDEILDRDVALKVLRKQYADDEQFVKRFEREAKSAGSLSHPNIVAVHDLGETEDGAYYIVMECMRGGTLKDRILKEGVLSPSEAIEVTMQIAQALKVAHRRGLIHRDIKPQNVLLSESGETKVADFGIARAASSTTITRAGGMLGTPHYVSPEMAQGEPASPQSDLYSLGVVLYEMLTGELPYDAETPVGVVMKHVSAPLRTPKEVVPDLPDGINAVCVRLLAKDPEERYQDSGALIEDLERVRRGELPATAAKQGGVNQDNTVLEDEVGTILEPSDGSEPEGRSQQEGRVSPASQEAVANHEPVRPPRTPQGSPSRSNKRAFLLAAAIVVLLVLASSGATALAGVGPAASLLRVGSERSPVDEELPAPPSDSQEDAVATEEESETEEEASTPSDDSAVSQEKVESQGQSETPSGTAFGADEQAPVAQTKAKSESPTVEVPDLAGQSRSEARSKLTAAGLKLGNQSETSDDKVSEGKVIGQNPAEGTKAEPGSSVDITISSGPMQVSVPNLVNLPVSDATSTLTAEGLTLGDRTEAPSDNVASGRVISQTPAPGTKAKRGSPVDIVCSCGSPQKDKSTPPPQQKDPPPPSQQQKKGTSLPNTEVEAIEED